ncbi:hypothetical protein TD95_004487 [Thielaviopsis punctulata]|uniref:Mannosyltransferase n=1 Tax=Thielaviopsis punctulata TaxID=72032 RepID=A0A0F4Z820_9PEZI|nr:hypothetical protein TD95_004487 [Thielaviopsis punctulata]
MKAYECLLPLAIAIHLLVAPYSKVEESFNTQATHDILVYGTPLSSARLRAAFDHFSFPGAVPRSFVGSLVLAGVAQPLVLLAGFQHAQMLVRAVLGAWNAFCLAVFARRLGSAFGENVARWYVVLQAAQFHVVFYASRLLPNMFAFGFTRSGAAKTQIKHCEIISSNMKPATLAFAFLLPDRTGRLSAPRYRLALSLLVTAGVIFRAELALLLAAHCLWLLIVETAPLASLLRPILFSAATALAVSVPVDSYFWQRPLWPELAGFYFNAVQGSSALWGTSPWWFYAVSALPRLLLNPLTGTLLIPYALSRPATSRRARALVAPCLIYVAAYSVQPHKEARFILYIVPGLTAAAALGASAIFTRRAKSAAYAAVALAVVLSAAASAAAATAMLAVSALNYPGGDALAALVRLHADDAYAVAAPRVHTDVLSCMTGVTLFGENPHGEPRGSAVAGRGMSFDKTEDPQVLADPDFWRAFDYVLHDVSVPWPPGKWEKMAVVRGYAGVEVVRPRESQDGAVVVATDGDAAAATQVEIVGKGALVKQVKQRVLEWTGGWWIGPRMEDKIVILRRARGMRGF